MNLTLAFSPSSYSPSLLALPYFIAALVLAILGVGFWPVGRVRRGFGTLAVLTALFAIIAGAHAMLAVAVDRMSMMFWIRVLAASLTLLPVAGAHFFHKLLRPRLMAPPLLLMNWVVSGVLATLVAIGPLAPDQLGFFYWGVDVGHQPLAPLLLGWAGWILLGVLRDFNQAYRKPLPYGASRHQMYALGLVSLFLLAGALSLLPRLGLAVPPVSFIPALIFLLGARFVLMRYASPETAPELASKNIIARIPDGLLVLDQTGAIRMANPAAARLLGRPPEQLLGRSAQFWFGELVAPTRLERTSRLPGGHGEHELPIRMRGGQISRTISLSIDAVRSPEVAGIAFICLFRDITEKKRLQNRMLQEGLIDPLTGFPNRGLFVQMVEQAVERARRDSSAACTVFFLNLDRFKLINDALGPVVGDRVLLAVADRLRRCLSPGDVLARLGGDEYGILCSDIHDEEAAAMKAQAFGDALAPPLHLEGRDIHVSASIGVVSNAQAYSRGNDLLRDADIAMANAKAEGGARHRAFAVEMREFMQRQVRLENELRAAVEGDQLRVYFQPIVHVGERRVQAFEALLRWEHPEHGLIPPDQFIEVAEETGLVIPMGQWLAGEVCRQLAHWRTLLPGETLSVSINVSDQELNQPELIVRLRQHMENHGLTPENLHLELTERMLMRRAESEVFSQIVGLGLPLHIDDFGTGYSSLSRLQDLPIHTLKVDRSFVHNMTANDSGATLVRAIIALAHNLDHRVIAEGVETREQLTALKAMGCEVMQGFYFSRPVDAQTAARLLTDQSWLKALI